MCLGRESYGRTYAVVELSYLQDNIKAVKSHLREGMQFCAVVKMDAYGHGIVEVARAVEEECSLFGVATIEEGIILRKGGITTPILILGVVPKGQYRSLWHYDIMPSLFTREQGEALSTIAKKEGKSLPCHLALDTGMGRIGIQVEKEDAVELGLELFSLSGIEICGISCFTNMAAGILDQPLSHEEVSEAANKVSHIFEGLVKSIIKNA